MKRRDNGEGTIFKRKDGRWSAEITVTMIDGTKKRIYITRKKREDVKIKMEKLLDMNKKNIRMSDKKWTVGEWLDYWLENTAKDRIRHSTWIGYESMIRLHIKPLLGNKYLTELGIRDVQLAIDKMASDKNIGSSVYKHFRQVLSVALNRAVREEIIFRNVAQYIELPKHIKKPIIPWTVEEAIRFLESSKEHIWYPALLIQLIYGMRRGEAIGLRWSDIDWKNNRIFVRQQLSWFTGDGIVAEDVKTEAGRRDLHLVAIVKAELIKLAEQQGIDPNSCFNPEALYNTDDVIVKNKVGGAICPENYSRTFSLLTKRAKVRNISNHTMRHTQATLLSRLGVQTKEIQLILGHTDQRTTESIYMHGNSDVQANALDMVSNFFGVLQKA
jgi:integrase